MVKKAKNRICKTLTITAFWKYCAKKTEQTIIKFQIFFHYISVLFIFNMCTTEYRMYCEYNTFAKLFFNYY